MTTARSIVDGIIQYPAINAVVGWAALCTDGNLRGLEMAVVLLLLLPFSLGAALLLGAVVVLNFVALCKLRS